MMIHTDMTNVATLRLQLPQEYGQNFRSSAKSVGERILNEEAATQECQVVNLFIPLSMNCGAIFHVLEGKGSLIITGGSCKLYKTDIFLPYWWFSEMKYLISFCAEPLCYRDVFLHFWDICGSLLSVQFLQSSSRKLKFQKVNICKTLCGQKIWPIENVKVMHWASKSCSCSLVMQSCGRLWYFMRQSEALSVPCEDRLC